MDLPILTAAVFGLAALTMSPNADRAFVPSASASAQSGESAMLVGQHIYGSEDPIDRWGDPVRAEQLSLEDLGRVAKVRFSSEGTPEAIVVSVGGLWGFGAQEVELGTERLRLVRAADGADRLVLDLSTSGAEPPLDGEEL